MAIIFNANTGVTTTASANATSGGVFVGNVDFTSAILKKFTPTQILQSNTDLNHGKIYFVNTNAQGNLVCKLPASANIGDTVRIIDSAGFAESNNIIIHSNGHKIDGNQANAVLNISRSGVTLVYSAANQGWISEKEQQESQVSGAQGEVSGYSSGGLEPSPAETNTIDKFSFTSVGNATDVGDLTQARRGLAGQSSSENGYTSGGGSTQSNIIDKFPFATDSNATDVGNLTQVRRGVAGQSSTVSGYSSGGFAPPQVNTIDKFPFATDSNATDVGNLTQTRDSASGQSSTVSGYSSGGNSPPVVNTIDKFPFATDSDATDVGNLSQSRQGSAGQSSTVSGYSSGGFAPPQVLSLIHI